MHKIKEIVPNMDGNTKQIHTEFSEQEVSGQCPETFQAALLYTYSMAQSVSRARTWILCN